LPAARVDSAGDVIADRAEPYEHANGRFVHCGATRAIGFRRCRRRALFSGRDIAPWSDGARRAIASCAARSWRRRPPGALLTTGRQVPYGFGWFVERTAGHHMQRHAGRVPGFGAFLMHLAGPELWVAATANTTPSPPLLLMALTAAEAFSPGSTFLSLPPEDDGRDARTLRARAVLERGSAPLNPEWFRAGDAGAAARWRRGIPGKPCLAGYRRSIALSRLNPTPCRAAAAWCAIARRSAATSRTISSAGPRTTVFSGRRRHHAAMTASTKRQATSFRIRSAAITNSSTVNMRRSQVSLSM
jgi:hypothetical protein